MEQQLLRTRPSQVHKQLQVFIVIQFAPLFTIQPAGLFLPQETGKTVERLCGRAKSGHFAGTPSGNEISYFFVSLHADSID